jgi:hypothetical protein
MIKALQDLKLNQSYILQYIYIFNKSNIIKKYI